MIDDKGSAVPRPEVVNRVVAWHNRHPLARRISATQVRHVGLVVLPFAASSPASDLDLDLPTAIPPLPPGASRFPELMEDAVVPEMAAPGPLAEPPDAAIPHESDHAQEGASVSDAPTDPAQPASADIELSAGAALDHAAATSEGAPSGREESSDEGPSSELASAFSAPTSVRLSWWRRLRQKLGRRSSATNGPHPLFSENLMPEIGVAGLVDLAIEHGMSSPPPGEHWLQRQAQIDRDRLVHAMDRGLTARADRILLTANIDDGTRRYRLLIGAGLKPHVVGPRLWDRARVTAMVAVSGLALCMGVWTVGHQTGAHAAAAQAAASSASAASAVLASLPSSAAAPIALPTASAASASVHEPADATALQAHHSASAVAAAPSSPASAPATSEPTALAQNAAPQSIVPNLRPQLANAAQVEASQRFALVSAPFGSGAEARTMLRRLREETTKIRHPMAVETSVHQSANGWRVTWWPFANQRQAENARAALAEQRMVMEVIEF